MIDPHRDTQYICSILDGGNEPLVRLDLPVWILGANVSMLLTYMSDFFKFRLQADDNPKEVFQGQTPTSVWTIAVRR